MSLRFAVRWSAALAAIVTAGLLPSVALGVPVTDARFAKQWANQPGAALDVSVAWNVSDGAGTVVAVIDSGIDLTHPDLRDSLWTNPGEIAANHIDDDRDGFIDDVHGVDMLSDDGDPTDRVGHGTHVAGIIAAARNSIGVVGVAPGARIMAIRVLDDANHGNTGNAAAGVRYAIVHRADIINMSLTGSAADEDLRQAIDEARTAGLSVVASAGNDAQNLSVTPLYPVAFKGVGLVSVAATERDGELAGFSDFGRGVSLGAPGVDILSTALGGGYQRRTGTSMAAPEVAGALALIRSARPDLSAAQRALAITSTTHRMSGLAGLLGGGELDLVAALRSVVPASSWPTLLSAHDGRRSRPGGRSLVRWSVVQGNRLIATYRISGAGGSLIGRARGRDRYAWVRLRRGRVRVTGLDAAGQSVAAATARVR